jgi:serine/threonine protein kinase
MSPGSDKTATAPLSPQSARACLRCTTINPPSHNFCSFCGHNIAGALPPSTSRDPLIGAVVGDRYRLLTKIGVGGMGSVYKVEHVHMGKLMAIKLLHGDLSRDEGMILRFNREARAVSRLASPHTVQVFDFGQSDGLVYIVMEYLRGRDLGRLLEDTGALDPPRCLDIARQIATSLREAHDYGIIHRDLKPENIFLCAPRRGQELVKVLDFGLARFIDHKDLNSQTIQGSLIGTPYYMSPEQIRNEDISPRSDLYSLAALLFKLLTGEPPYIAPAPLNVLSAHLHHPIPLASERAPERAASLRALDPVLQKALAKAPADRFASVQDFVDALAVAVEQISTPAPLQPAPTAHPATDPLEPSLDISTRQDWERYARHLRLRRAALSLAALSLTALIASALWWGLAQGHLLRHAREQEPNEQPAQATRLYIGDTIEGTIGLPTGGRRADQDLYALRHNGPPGELLQIEITGVEGLDLILEAFDNAGQRVAAADAGDIGQGEWLHNLRWTGDPLYIAAREVWIDGFPARSASSQPYLIRTSAIPSTAQQEAEPNDSTAHAHPLRAGDLVLGYISEPTDRDLYALPPLPPEGLELLISLQAPPPQRLALEVVGGGGVKLRDLPLDPLGHARLFVAPLGRQPIHLGVVIASGTPDPRGAAQPYQLSLEAAPLKPPPISGAAP